jgi:NADPH-dependent 2,4-dienoyl-CoA reductase/sulfur reductase-like enzyme/nitrite reductase/ring-hydroxylating ferredoxin subunit
MADEKDNKPDLKTGFPAKDLTDGGMVAGQLDGEDILLARRGNEYFAVGAFCSHYHGPLADGLIVGDSVRCPWHHACFSLRTGEALHAPALDSVGCWRTEKVNDKIFIREKLDGPKPDASKNSANPDSVVIIGGGAAGLAAADMLRRKGYQGSITMLSADESGPTDRPNLSKDFLAGTASEDWIPLRAPDYYSSNKIDLVLNSRVASVDVKKKQVQLENGKTYSFGALLLATGAEPVKLPIEGAKPSQVFYLRSFSDSKAIIARAEPAKKVVVVGSSFIGLEVAASLRQRKLEVHVVSPDKQPLERVMGAEVGAFIHKLHEEHGVVFHLGQTVARVDGSTVKLSGGSSVEADFLVVGAGVKPALALAERAGLAMDRGVTVNEFLETNAPGIFAAGDIARWPDAHSGEKIRVEHWVVAERQGQIAAQNILGRRVPFKAVPFFWSAHYDVTINYVGHAEKWDSTQIEGNLENRDCAVHYKRGGKTLAVATIFRDLESLKIEAQMESK